jgi:hypothetical protein
MSETTAQAEPTWLELERIIPLPEAEIVTSLGADTLRRAYPHLIVRLSPRRVGMKMRDALSITRGQAKIS